MFIQLRLKSAMKQMKQEELKSLLNKFENYIMSEDIHAHSSKGLSSRVEALKDFRIRVIDRGGALGTQILLDSDSKKMSISIYLGSRTAETKFGKKKLAAPISEPFATALQYLYCDSSFCFVKEEVSIEDKFESLLGKLKSEGCLLSVTEISQKLQTFKQGLSETEQEFEDLISTLEEQGNRSLANELKGSYKRYKNPPISGKN